MLIQLIYERNSYKKLSMETIENKNKTQLFTLLFTLFSVIFNNLL